MQIIQVRNYCVLLSIPGKSLLANLVSVFTVIFKYIKMSCPFNVTAKTYILLCLLHTILLSVTKIVHVLKYFWIKLCNVWIFCCFSISSIQEERSRIHNMSVIRDAVYRRAEQPSSVSQTCRYCAHTQPWSMSVYTFKVTISTVD